MAMMNQRWMEITLTGGRTLKFKFPTQATDETAAQRIEEVLKLPSVSIRADDKLWVIPTHSIQTITVSPAPAKLPRTVIRGATLI
jgi:hypothetical protein